MPALDRPGRHEQRRRALLADLSAIARRLSDDELRVLLTIALRAWVGQTKYGCLRLAGDRRDFRGEAFEEACDAAFYLAAGLLAGCRNSRRSRRHQGPARA